MKPILLAALAAFLPLTAAAEPAPSRDDIEAIIRDYILANPDVVAEALERHAEEQAAQAEIERQAAMGELTATLFADPQTPRVGAEAPTVTMVEFFDYNCGFCRRVADSVISLAEDEDDLAILLIEMPILSPGSVEAAQAALAAKRQDAYWDFHVAMLKRRGRADRDAALAVASELGLDVDQLMRDMGDPAITATIEANLDWAQRVGVRGTPAFIIGETFIPGAAPLDQLRAAVAEARGS